ncbi:hypothetical protein D9757_006728 [Collybiopsis confluens]|uniref:Uncharacterized protein n=1 Tax=Collybiopsis confluens TaxID=2823264 RepID=A0A8H5HLZ0_9AGAR|nr:hypothetical protein D9757_006728 [Collybiopsis confluens]
MVEPGKRMVLNMEQVIPDTTYSVPLEYRMTGTLDEETPEQSSPDVIASILSDWKSFQDLDEDNWFEEIAESGSLAK